jgi:hypothetical protein
VRNCPGSELKTVQQMDSAGRLKPLVGTPGDYRANLFSRDGKRLAVAIAVGGASGLYVSDVERHQQPERLTAGAKISAGWGLEWLSYAPDETGVAQTCVTEVANPARKINARQSRRKFPIRDSS